jgi:hypothetical protein
LIEQYSKKNTCLKNVSLQIPVDAAVVVDRVVTAVMSLVVVEAGLVVVVVARVLEVCVLALVVVVMMVAEPFVRVL